MTSPDPTETYLSKRLLLRLSAEALALEGLAPEPGGEVECLIGTFRFRPDYQGDLDDEEFRVPVAVRPSAAWVDILDALESAHYEACELTARKPPTDDNDAVDLSQ